MRAPAGKSWVDAVFVKFSCVCRWLFPCVLLSGWDFAFKDRQEEVSLQILSSVTLIQVIRLDGAEVKRRRPSGVTFIFVRFPDKPLI